MTREMGRRGGRLAGGYRGLAVRWFAKMIARIPPEAVARYVEDGRDPIEDLVRLAPETVMFAKQLATPFAKLLVGVDADRALAELRRVNPMAAGVIMNHPNGKEWLRLVLLKVKELMTAKDVICEHCQNPFPLYPPGRKKYSCPYCGAEYEF